MALRTPAYLKSVFNRLGGKNSTFATSTTPKTKAYAPALNGAVPHEDPKTINRLLKGDFAPVMVALGLITMSATFGLYTALHQLSRAPNVFVRKSRRETIPEVVEPDKVVEEADKFIKKSFFRKVAHIQQLDEPIIPNHPARCEILASPPKAETLLSVGVDPKASESR